ncbi:MAG: hypothetical protein ACUVXA_12615 [Candidatus Jordarchaeum sp.]|uniref:hypothetical protein n=1 Tax=Candidatus Jordarchaeum sp. TaxID=2823881 RepID=UPI00404A42E5
MKTGNELFQPSTKTYPNIKEFYLNIWIGVHHGRKELKIAPFSEKGGIKSQIDFHELNTYRCLNRIMLNYR